MADLTVFVIERESFFYKALYLHVQQFSNIET